jgi:hypothetical protein
MKLIPSGLSKRWSSHTRYPEIMSNKMLEHNVKPTQPIYYAKYLLSMVYNVGNDQVENIESDLVHVPMTSFSTLTYAYERIQNKNRRGNSVT